MRHRIAVACLLTVAAGCTAEATGVAAGFVEGAGCTEQRQGSQPFTLSHPLAADASVELHIAYEHARTCGGHGYPVDCSTANVRVASSDPAVLRIDEFRSHRDLRVTGLRPGTAELRLGSDRGPFTTITVRVAPSAAVSLLVDGPRGPQPIAGARTVTGGMLVARLVRDAATCGDARATVSAEHVLLTAGGRLLHPHHDAAHRRSGQRKVPA